MIAIGMQNRPKVQASSNNHIVKNILKSRILKKNNLKITFNSVFNTAKGVHRHDPNKNLNLLIKLKIMT